MKKIILVFAALAAVVSLHAQWQRMPESLAGDPDYQVYQQVLRRPIPRTAPGASPTRDEVLAKDAAARDGHEAIRVWMAKHPDHPSRSWVALNLASTFNPPRYITEIKPGPDTDIEKLLVCDDQARFRAIAERRQWLQQARKDPAMTTDQHSHICFFMMRDAIRNTQTRAELDGLRSELDAMVAGNELVDGHVAAVYGAMFWTYSANYGAAAVDEYLATLAAHPSPVVRKRAAEEVERLRTQRSGLDFVKFTAVDGREVDISKLRGKVVLVDFGATWCAPCIAEIPNMVEAYEKYHDKGFEIIGISLEDARVTESDSSEQAARKVGQERRKLEALIAKHGIKWPVYFGTKRMKEEFCVRLGINGIPAMFLLDQEGKVVSTATRGEALDQELRRMLKL